MKATGVIVYLRTLQWQQMLRLTAPKLAGELHTFAEPRRCHEYVLVLRKILEVGGSTVDAAIAAMLCDGVYHMHSTGLFGSSFMLIYER